MKVTREVKARVKATLEKCIVTANAHYGRTFKYPTVLYTKRGRTAGTANDSTYTVNFNAVLLMENVEDFLKRTVIHEMAHLIDGIVSPEAKAGGRWGRKRDIHGPRWKGIMKLLGGPTSRCHSYDTTNSKIKRTKKPKHVWKCGCGNGSVKLTAAAHKKQLNATGTYGYYQRGHTVRQCGKYSYFGLEGATLQPMALAADQPKPIPTTLTGMSGTVYDVVRVPKPATGLTKLARCRALFDSNVCRATHIQVFIDEVGCTPAGAATYYAKINKEV